MLGYGFRTSEIAVNEIKEAVAEIDPSVEVIPIKLLSANFYHLDTALCVLNEEILMVYAAAIHPDSLALLRKRYQIIYVNDEDAGHFACNALVMDKNVVMPETTPDIRNELERLGFKVTQIPMTSFMKAGGAAKCLSYPIPATVKIKSMKPNDSELHVRDLEMTTLEEAHNPKKRKRTQ